MTQFRNHLGAVLLVVLLAGPTHLRAAETPAPSFQEVYDLLRTNLTGVDDAALNRAAVEGLIARLGAKVSLDAMAGTNVDKPALASSAVFDGAFGYLRIARVGVEIKIHRLWRLTKFATIGIWLYPKRHAPASTSAGAKVFRVSRQ